MTDQLHQREGESVSGPMTEQGRWLLDHQGLVNISKPAERSMRGDEIDLRQSILTIEAEAHAAGRAAAREEVAERVRQAMNETRRAHVAAPPHMDGVDAAIGYALNDFEARLSALLSTEEGSPTGQDPSWVGTMGNVDD